MRWKRSLCIALLAAVVAACRAAGEPTGPPAGGSREGAAGAPATPTGDAARVLPAPTAAPPEHIVIALPSAGGVFAPHFLAEQQGFFREEGLDVEIAVMRGNLGPAGLLAGAVDYTGTISGTVRDAMAGVPSRVIAATVDKSTRRLMTVPGITSVEQVRGKTIAVAAIGD